MPSIPPPRPGAAGAVPPTARPAPPAAAPGDVARPAHGPAEEIHVGHETLRRISGIDRTNRWLFDVLKPHLGRRVLEAGSGIGNLSQFLLDRDRLVCVDLDPEHLETLERRFGGEPRVRLARADIADRALVEIGREEEVDSILCVNVLEHIGDDAGTLRNFHELLPPGGTLVLLVPSMPSLFCPLDEALGHFRRYRPADLTGRMEEAGFQILDVRYLNLFGIPGWLLSGKILRRRVLPTSLLWLFNAAVPLFRLVEWLTGPPIGLSVVAVGRKG